MFPVPVGETRGPCRMPSYVRRKPLCENMNLTQNICSFVAVKLGLVRLLTWLQHQVTSRRNLGLLAHYTLPDLEHSKENYM
jgi:hypothetical protein